MPYKRITRAEARDWKRRAEQAETKLRNLLTYNMPGIHIGAETITDINAIRMRLARTLHHGLLVVMRNENVADIYAVKS